MSETGIWDRYWRYDRIASCFDGAGAGNYDDNVAAGWRGFFGGLGEGARIIDLATGNGAAALIAAQARKGFAITAVDQADIDPPAYVSRHAGDYAAIRFLGRTGVEALPFPDASFDAAVSQYGIEYADLARALPELVRVLAPGGRVRLVVHAAEGVVAADARKVIADADFLLDGIDLAGCAARCFTAVLAVERAPAAGDTAVADRAFANFQSALERAARYVPEAHDKVMVRNTGAVLLDSFSRRAAFDLDQLLAKVEEARSEIRAHRGRLVALLDSALDRGGAEALAARLGALGATEATAAPLAGAHGLIGHVVAAQFPERN